MKHSLRLRAFAKVNLGLKILAKRPDGYHEIRTIYQTVALADRLSVSLAGRGLGISVESDDSRVPSGRPNLVYRACKLWARARKFRGGLRVVLNKQIPPGSGLGGASADAAVTLLGLEKLTGDRLDLETRLRLAAQLGSDVPLFFWGGRVLGCGRGEDVYPLWDFPSQPCLIVFPGFSVATADAYRLAARSAPLRLTESAAHHKIVGFGAWSHFPLEHWGPAENDFERVVFARWPELARLKRRLIRAGAETASLTGSGSAVFAVFDSARKLLSALRFVPPGWQTFRTRTLPRAEYERLVLA